MILSVDGKVLYLEVSFWRAKGQCGSSGLGHRPSRLPGLWLGPGVSLVLVLVLVPGVNRSMFLPSAPLPPSRSDGGVFTTTSFSTRPESNLCSGSDDVEERWALGGLFGAASADVAAGLQGAKELPEGAGCLSNQSGFWLMCWCMLQMAT